MQIEKYGSAKTQKFHIGDEFYIRAEGYENSWEFVEILDIYIQDSIIVFDNGSMHVGDITALQTRGQRQFGKIFKLTFVNFGTGIMVYSLYDLIAGRPYNWNAPIVAGSSFATGYLGQLILNQRYHRMGKRKRLRVLDLSFKEETFGQ